VISTSKRDDAFKVRADLMSQFPDQKTYVVFQSPSFKVRIGNFLKKEDAEKLKVQLNKFYPNGVYIVDDGIEYTPKEEEEIITQ
jgi:bisphosphoglycerate-independent phosphoglycerate mutase (AlkP superfamily)